ncbi:hypothetical protein ACFWY5_14320 [Nonomuraea sp. NPDC059007]|uniref:hypothetical protein n=1 Tax=Nonomuraea sp. NPDC059007 TaxID=3346692 RepID=UPI0036A77048
MTRRLASQNVSIGAVATLSALMLGACAQQPPPVYERSPVTVHEADDEEDEVTAHCVVRDSEDDGRYTVAGDEKCDGAGRHGTYMWYYGGTRTKRHVTDGSPRRPRGVFVTTRDGDEIGKSGRISREGFGGRTTVGG